MALRSAWWQRWRYSRLRDLALALGMAALTVAGSYGEAYPNSNMNSMLQGHRLPHEPAAAFLIVAAAALLLYWRNRYPLAVLAGATAAVVVYTLLGYVNGTALLIPAVALYAVTVASPLRRAILYAIATTVVLMAAAAAVNPLGRFGGGFDVIPAETAAALFLGIAVANRRALVASLERRAAEEAARRVDEERLRIARELHDVVSHTMATINVQAGVAAHVLAERPDAAADALEAIKSASKEGLRELRAILDLLRQADEAEPTEPAPGLDPIHLDTLVAGARQAGLQTTLVINGPRRPLDAATDLAAYRIIQESLTNAIRHAGPASATITLDYRPDALLLEISDNGRGAANDPSGGHGLVGMRERATAAGGSFEAGPSPDGGFRVRAELPLEASSAFSPAPAPSGAPT
jgi:signal transduction histidine kinase